jgi:hypothetical protein
MFESKPLVEARGNEDGHQGAVAELGPTVQTDAAPEARGDQAPRPRRGIPCGHRAQLQRQRGHDFTTNGMTTTPEAPDKASQPPDLPKTTDRMSQPLRQGAGRRAFWFSFYGEAVRWLAVLVSACAAYFAWQNWLNSDPVFSISSQTIGPAADKTKLWYAVAWENVGGTTATDFSMEAVSVDPAQPTSRHVLLTATAANALAKGSKKRVAHDINKAELEDTIVLCFHFKTSAGKKRTQHFYYLTGKNDRPNDYPDWHMETDVTTDVEKQLAALNVC